LRYSENRSSGNTRIQKQRRQEEDDTFNDLPVELIGNDNAINYSVYLRRILASQQEMQQQNKEEKVNNTKSSFFMLTNKISCHRKPNNNINENESMRNDIIIDSGASKSKTIIETP
jgi:hypothetical protein